MLVQWFSLCFSMISYTGHMARACDLAVQLQNCHAQADPSTGADTQVTSSDINIVEALDNEKADITTSSTTVSL